MCCLFGFVDYQHRLSGKEKAKLTHLLAASSEARGTDATGIAYVSGGKLHVYKRPLPGRRIHFHIPGDAFAVMGHTRMATQGSARRNYNNHPFKARAGGQPFALAHNGVVHNDTQLRSTCRLPRTNIETDSFVAVQLLEQRGEVSFSSLGEMVQGMEGSYTFTVLDGQNSLYFVKGDNPLCIYHYPKQGLYLYASTEFILMNALSGVPFLLEEPKQVIVTCGEILRIDASGGQTRAEFDAQNLFRHWYAPYSYMLDPPAKGQSIPVQVSSQKEYIQTLKRVASFYGFSSGCIDSLLADGFTTDDIEEMIYCGEL